MLSRVSKAVASAAALEARTKIKRACFQIWCLAANCVAGGNNEYGIEALGHYSVCMGLHYLPV